MSDINNFNNSDGLPGYGFDESNFNSGSFDSNAGNNINYSSSNNGGYSDNVFNSGMNNSYGGNNYNYGGSGNNYGGSNNGYNSSNYGSNNYGNNAYAYANENADTLSGLGNLKAISSQKVVTKSFLFMFAALLITAFASLTTSLETAINILSGAGLYILLIAEIAIVLISNSVLKKGNVVLGGILYTIYSYLTGMTLSVIFWVYTTSSILSVFIITAVMFGTVAIFGMVTKKDLTKLGSLCMMGLWGIIISGAVNMFFFGSLGFDFVISVIGVVIFVGLTAYDMQNIKNMCKYSTIENENALAMMGAFEIYLDFINLFLKLIRLMGKRK